MIASKTAHHAKLSEYVGSVRASAQRFLRHFPNSPFPARTTPRFGALCIIHIAAWRFVVDVFRERSSPRVVRCYRALWWCFVFFYCFLVRFVRWCRYSGRSYPRRPLNRPTWTFSTGRKKKTKKRRQENPFRQIVRSPFVMNRTSTSMTTI